MCNSRLSESRIDPNQICCEHNRYGFDVITESLLFHPCGAKILPRAWTLDRYSYTAPPVSPPVGYQFG